MKSNATVKGVTTVTKHLPGDPQVDIVKLSLKGRAYFVETPVGKCSVDEVVRVAFSASDEQSVPMSIQLAD